MRRFERSTKLSTISLTWFGSLTLAQPPQEQQKWNQRKHEKDRPAAAMDYTMNHLRTCIHAEKSNHEDAKSVP